MLQLILPLMSRRDEGRKSLWNLLLVAVCFKHQLAHGPSSLSLQLSSYTGSNQKRVLPCQWRASIIWPQCQTWHMADFWMSQRGHCRPRLRNLQHLYRYKLVAVSSWFSLSFQFHWSRCFLQRQAVISHLHSLGASQSPSGLIAAFQPLIWCRKIYSGVSP